jgi:hypothetical protein
VQGLAGACRVACDTARKLSARPRRAAAGCEQPSPRARAAAAARRVP